MDKIKLFIAKYPTHIKYVLIVLDILFALVAIRIFINYNNIKQAIQDTTLHSSQQTQELAFSENFELTYQKSEYAQFFLKHENNMLLPWEFIVKFQAIKKVLTWDLKTITSGNNQEHFIVEPRESRNRFLQQKIFDSPSN